MFPTVKTPSDGPAEIMAAVDLGSNSFHMVVARLHHGQFIILDRLREMVRFASGLNSDGYLDNPSQDKALGCLRRFGQRLRDMHASNVRVVGTNTLRKARNAYSFLAAAESVLGHPVEVVSGMEEARLIYLGVAYHIGSEAATNLVVDIGGGSTELIIGEGREPRRMGSLSLGCVRLSNRFFRNEKLSRKRFERARLAAQLELRPICTTFRRLGWSRAIGSSGTIRAAAQIAQQMGLAERGVTLGSVETLIDEMIAARRIEDLELPGLSADRAPVFPGGIAILTEIMSSLSIDRMDVTDGSLREGLLYDMFGRMHHHDPRELSVQAMQQRYHVDEEQARRVEMTALTLLDKVERQWQLDGEQSRPLLRWAARLHEVGLDIAHARYHDHGGYLLANADMAGFAHLEQRLVAKLVACHRRKLDGMSLDALPESWRVPLFRLIVLLRLAVLLNRTRSSVRLPDLGLVCEPDGLKVLLPRTWYAENALTQADLGQEQAWLETCGFELSLGTLAAVQEASAS